ncbi:MAG: mycothiol synthase, partial [Dermatophilaceae bacterium]
MPTVTVLRRDAQRPLTAAESSSVLAAVTATTLADGASPLSEQFRLSLDAGDVDRDVDRDRNGVWHLLARHDDGSADPEPADDRGAPAPVLAGYAQVRSGEANEPASAELFVAPDARRTGVGSALLDALPADVRIWSHDDNAAAGGFASARGLTPVRSLHVMHRSLTGGTPWPAVDLPGTYLVRPFEPGRDEAEWLAVNAAAFVHHPEQGSLDRADLDQRMAQAWFDPAGLILIVPRADPDEIAAFHWTKVDPPDGSR